MKIAFYGSQPALGVLERCRHHTTAACWVSLAKLGWQVTFYEPDAFDRQAHRDIEPPDWARVVVYQATPAACQAVIAEAAQADVVVKASGVGIFDTELLAVMQAARRGALRIFWDVDAPATLAELRAAVRTTRFGVCCPGWIMC